MVGIVKALVVFATVVRVSGQSVTFAEPGRMVEVPGMPAMGGLPLGHTGVTLSQVPSYMDGMVVHAAPHVLPKDTVLKLSCPGAGGEDAFAVLDSARALCFSSKGFDKWGWTNFVEHDVSMNLYTAGNGGVGCEKGVKVGKVVAAFSEGSVKVRYEVDEGYRLSEVHLHVGVTSLPMHNGMPSVDVHHFPTIDDTVPVTTEFSFPVQGDGIYISAHAVVSAQSSCCTFFMAVHHCPPCSTPFNGGWDALLQTGWEARSCGPKVRRGQNENPMVVYRTEVPAGSSLTTVPSSKPTAHLAIFSTTKCGVEWCQKSKGHRPVLENSCVDRCPEFIPKSQE